MCSKKKCFVVTINDKQFVSAPGEKLDFGVDGYFTKFEVDGELVLAAATHLIQTIEVDKSHEHVTLAF